MRFLFASSFAADPDSGAAGSLLAIGAALEERGHAVDYLWRGGERGRLPHPGLTRLLELPRRQLGQVAGRLDRERYDVVCVSQPYAYLVYEQLPARHPSTLFLNRTHGWEDRMAAANRRFGFLEADRGRAGRSFRLAAEALTRRCCERTARACHALIAPSTLCAEFIGGAYRGVGRGKVAVIPYGVADDFLEPAAPGHSADPGALRLLFVGQYLPRKGSRLLEKLLPRLARRYPALTVTCVVPAEAVEVVRAAYGGAFGARLQVLSWMPRQRLRAVYAAHDVFLYPSYFEGFAKTVLEAMASGLCVVGFGEGGLADLARPGREALYRDPGDEEGLEALLETCIRAPARARAIGARARAAVAWFTWARNAELTERLCVRLSRRTIRIPASASSGAAVRMGRS